MVHVKVEHLIVLLMGLFLLHYFLGNCGRRVEGFELSWDTGITKLIENEILNIPKLVDHASDINVTGTRAEGQCCDLPTGYVYKRSKNMLTGDDNTVCKPGLHCLMGAPAASQNSCPRTKSGLNQSYHGYCNKAFTPLDMNDPGNIPN